MFQDGFCVCCQRKLNSIMWSIEFLVFRFFMVTSFYVDTIPSSCKTIPETAGLCRRTGSEEKQQCEVCQVVNGYVFDLSTPTIYKTKRIIVVIRPLNPTNEKELPHLGIKIVSTTKICVIEVVTYLAF